MLWLDLLMLLWLMSSSKCGGGVVTVAELKAMIEAARARLRAKAEARPPLQRGKITDYFGPDRVKRVELLESTV